MEAELRKVIAAWVLEEETHREERKQLYQNWPSLARALDELVRKDFNRSK